MSKTPIITTPRLFLRQWVLSDAAYLFELNSDPEVIRYTCDPPFLDEAEAQKLIENYNQYDYGMGRLAVVRKSDDEILGWCGLKYHPEDDMVDIGYRFFREHWNQGYATEAAKACIDYGFNTLGLQQIVAHAMRENGPSFRVMEKCGMHYERDCEMHGNAAKLYVINATDS